MKRLITILIMITYLTMNCGLVISSHYCGGKLASISLFDFNDTKCEKCGQKMAKDCCKDTKTQLSVDDDQQLARSNTYTPFDYSQFLALVSTISFQLTPSSARINSNNTRFYVFETGPPKTPIYIQIRSLLI
jgi:hypothetical protein